MLKLRQGILRHVIELASQLPKHRRQLQGRRTAFVCGAANEVRKDERNESNAAGFFFLQFDFLNGYKSYNSEVEIFSKFRTTNRQKRRQYILFITNEYLIIDIHLNPYRFYRDAFSS